MLFKIKSTLWFLVMGVILLVSCHHQSALEPEDSVCFTLKLQLGRHPGTQILGLISAESSQDHGDMVGKKLDIQAIDLARIMVVDLSAYSSWDDLLQKPEWFDYVEARDNWTGDLSQWGEWEKLIGNYFNVVTNQVLDIVGDYAEGTVTGVIGLNRIVVALVENNRITYWGEGDAVGGAGEAEELVLEVYEHYVEQVP
jgi:hypothetical protein